MADLTGGLTTGVLRDWLAARRALLNGRFRAAARRFPKLEPGVVLALCKELLPPLAQEPHPNLPALFEAVFELVLLHAGRGTLTPEPGGGRNPAVGVLLRETFPALRSLLLARPRSLPGALSNAAENLGRRGIAFARTLPAVGARLADADQLPAAGAVLAWRLGDARLRNAALAAAVALPPGAVLPALGVPSWPSGAAPLLLAALAADGWRTPEGVFAAATLDELAAGPGAGRLEALRLRAVARPAAPLARWALADRVGNFRGFDGDFDEPPVLLADGRTTRHRFWVRSGRDAYRVDADAFGWVCGAAGPAEQPPCPPTPPAGLAAPGRATSVLALPDLAAYTRSDSFRIRLLVPPGEPL
jgi:hypothetical protein